MIHSAKALLWGLAACTVIFFCTLIGHCQACVTASQVTLTGNLRSSNGLPAVNYVMTLTPTQQGYIAGCGVNIITTNTCATSIDGSVVGLPNPQTATINTTGSGSLGSGTYYTVYEWYDAAGNVTLSSPETRTTLSGAGALVVNPPSSGVPSLAVGMDVFIGVTSGGETLQGQTVGSASFVQSSALTSGISPASTNTTLCQIVANDAIWPTGTGYNVSMVDVNGNPIPAYPMQWQLLGPGTTINLSNGLPYYHGVVFYPVPVLVAPASHGAQSISGPLALGGYNLTQVGKLGVGTGTPGWGVDVEGSGLGGYINAKSGYLLNGSGGVIGQCLSSDGTAYDTPIPCVGYYQTIQGMNTPFAQEIALNFLSGFTVTDDAVNHRTNVAITAVGGAKVQLSLPATTVNANTCSTPATATLAGVTSTSTFSTAFATNPNAAVGWGANGGLVVELWPDASPDTLDWSICNQTSSNITPTAITLNVGVQ